VRALDALGDDPGLAQDLLMMGERRLADRQARGVVQFQARRVADRREGADRDQPGRVGEGRQHLRQPQGRCRGMPGVVQRAHGTNTTYGLDVRRCH
jgi:hypothetical protein